jgi:hypothetical protein
MPPSCVWRKLPDKCVPWLRSACFSWYMKPKCKLPSGISDWTCQGGCETTPASFVLLATFYWSAHSQSKRKLFWNGSLLRQWHPSLEHSSGQNTFIVPIKTFYRFCERNEIGVFMPMKGGLFVMCFICFLNRYKCRWSLPFVWSIWEGGGHIYSKRSKVLLASFVLHFIACEVPPLCKQMDIINSGFFRSYRLTIECLGFESGLLMTCLLFNGGSSFQDWRISRICICSIQVCWWGTEGHRALGWWTICPFESWPLFIVSVLVGSRFWWLVALSAWV